MKDDFNENDLVNLSGHEGSENAIPDAVTSKFDEVFSKIDEAEAGVEAENTPAPEVSDEEKAGRKERARVRGNERLRQEQEELQEDGLVDEDGEPVEGKQPADAVEEDGEKDNKGEESAAADAVENVETAKLDPALRFVAQEFGWTDDKINKLVAADAELATETFQKLADVYTASSRQLLNQPASPVAPGTLGQPQQSPAQAAGETPLSKLDTLYANLKQFAEVNGQSLVDEFLTPLKTELIDPVRQMMAEAIAQKQDNERTAARQTMGTLEQKFADFYGVSDKSQTKQQVENRRLLGQTADQIRHASKFQGKQLSVTEALNRAHLLVTAEHREQVVRSQIKEQVQRRSKSITAKPTQRANPKLVAAKSAAKASEAINNFWADKGTDVDLD